MKKKYKSRLARLAYTLGQASNREVISYKDREILFRMYTFAIGQRFLKNKGYFSLPRKIEPREVSECGTSCCFLGYAPIVFPYLRRKEFNSKDDLKDWVNVSKWVIGTDDNQKNHDLWQFLFGAFWNNDTEKAIRRALEVLKNDVPKDFDANEIYENKFYCKDKTKNEVMQELKTYF